MPPRLQFGVGQLLWLTTVVALVAALAATFQATATAKGLLAGYLGVIAVWLVLRGPAVAAGLRDVRRRRRALDERRRAMLAEALKRRQEPAGQVDSRP